MRSSLRRCPGAREPSRKRVVLVTTSSCTAPRPKLRMETAAAVGNGRKLGGGPEPMFYLRVCGKEGLPSFARRPLISDGAISFFERACLSFDG